MAYNTENERKILATIESLPETQWYRIEDIVQKSGLATQDIYSVINQSDDYVLSSDDQMQPVVTTRNRFRKSEPLFRKIVGAFKNRID